MGKPRQRCLAFGMLSPHAVSDVSGAGGGYPRQRLVEPSAAGGNGPQGDDLGRPFSRRPQAASKTPARSAGAPGRSHKKKPRSGLFSQASVEPERRG